MADNNLRIIQGYDFQIVRGNTLIMPFKITNLDDPSIWDMELDIVDPFSGDVIPMALGATYSKRHNPSASGGEGIYYNTDTSKPDGYTLSADNQIFIKLNQADTEKFKGNQTYHYDLNILNANKTIVTTFVQGKIHVLRRALDA